MRKRLLWGLGICFIATAQLSAQTLSTPIDTPERPAPKSPPNLTTTPALVDLAPACSRCDCYRFWARSEYLMWWVKNAPMPAPLVTTGDPNVGFAAGVNTAGAIGQPGTGVLFGGSSVDYHTLSGARFTVGAWLDDEQLFGVEGSGFFLAQGANHFSASSDAAGNPPLYFPAFNVAAGQERALPIADPLRGFSGNVAITSIVQLWGAELNGCFTLWRQPGLQVSLLAGFRYLDLRESLQIQNTTTDLIFMNTETETDRFSTRNQFYGGQLGTRIGWQRERLSVDLTGKVALGSNHEVVDIQGSSSQTPLPGGFAPTPGTFPGGIFAQTSNIGRQTRNQFTVVPALEMKIAYQLTQRLRASVGYDFLYWNQVVRPGNQIDHNINPSQSTLFGGGALVGQASPAPLFQRSDFWSQGVSFGLEFRF